MDIYMETPRKEQERGRKKNVIRLKFYRIRFSQVHFNCNTYHIVRKGREGGVKWKEFFIFSQLQYTAGKDTKASLRDCGKEQLMVRKVRVVEHLLKQQILST